jgi:hypothetical protein
MGFRSHPRSICSRIDLGWVLVVHIIWVAPSPKPGGPCTYSTHFSALHQLAPMLISYSVAKTAGDVRVHMALEHFFNRINHREGADALGESAC